MVFWPVVDPLTFSLTMLLAPPVLIVIFEPVSHPYLWFFYNIGWYIPDVGWISLFRLHAWIFEGFLESLASLCDTTTRERICASLESLLEHLPGVIIFLYFFRDSGITCYVANSLYSSH